MKPTRLLAVLAATAACALGSASTAAAATDVSQSSSENWSGYVVGGAGGDSSYRTVSGSWVVPTAHCSSSRAYSAFWVGLGGAGNTEALEQAGTEGNCDEDGNASYYAWYELVPSAPARLNLAVNPGDHISTRVTVNGTAVAISMTDATTGLGASKGLTMDDPDTSSAEWIAEAPSSCGASASSCTPLPLTDFGTVTFTSASATDSGGHTGTISDGAWSTAAVTLTPGADSSGYEGVDIGSSDGSGAAQPSALSSDGSSFSVTYSSDGSAARGAGGGGGPYGNGGYGDGGGGYGPGDGYGYGYGGHGYGDDGGYSGW